MVFMSSVLQMYQKLFDNMLATPTPSSDVASGSGAQDADTSAVKQQVHYLRDMVHKLQRHRYLKQKELLKNLTKLEHIQV